MLHDHYKETFARIREAEGLRDRLFLVVIALYALLSLEIGYPAAVGGSLGTVTVAGAEVNLQALPLEALLTATWVLTLTISLRYCQKCILVDRQYDYLHKLEDALSEAVGGGDLYRREGKVYLTDYPFFLDVSWISYVILFPLIVILATVGLLWRELSFIPHPLFHIIVDSALALALIGCFYLYRVHPRIIALWRNRKKRKQAASAVDSQAIK